MLRINSSLACLCLFLTTLGITTIGCNKASRLAYQYRIPEITNDGWQTASMAGENLDPVIIGRLFQRINDRSYKNVHSVLVVKNGKLIIEEYFPGTNSNGDFRPYDRDRVHELASVTKTITSICAGIAIDQQLIKSTDQSISDLLPEYAVIFADHKRDDVRMKHLLTMTAGLAWDEWTFPYSDPRNDWTAMHHSKDFVGYVLTRPVAHPPGTQFAYSGGLSFVIGEIVHHRSGMRLDEFARRHLFQPLGITQFFWHTFPDGSVEGESNLALRPRDMAKIGLLFLNRGCWEGKQIVSEKWVEDSTENHVDARQFPSWNEDDGYGYQWWLRSFHVNAETIPSYHAAGMGGQFIFVFPSLQMVAVFTGWAENELGKQPLDMVQQYVLPAALKPTGRASTATPHL